MIEGVTFGLGLLGGGKAYTHKQQVRKIYSLKLSPLLPSSLLPRCCKIRTFSRDEFRIECLKLTWQQGVLDVQGCMLHLAHINAAQLQKSLQR